MAHICYIMVAVIKSESFRRGKDRWVLSDESMPPAYFGKDLTIYFIDLVSARKRGLFLYAGSRKYICRILQNRGEDFNPLFFMFITKSAG